MSAVISDFGGVLTTPLESSFVAFSERTGVPLRALGEAIAAQAIAQGANPLFELETGRLAEAEFLDAIGRQLSDALGREVAMDGFGESFFDDLEVNEPFVAYVRALHDRGYSTGLCTNNVREWSELWRALVPVEEIFDVVVDSSDVGARKPDPEIYEIMLRELGVAPSVAVFIDDLEPNCAAARELGMHAVWFRDTEQAIADTDAALAAE